MLKTILSLGLISLLVLVTQACTPQAAPTVDPNAVGTAIAQTLAAMATPTSQAGIPVTGNESPTPTAIVIAPTATQAASPTLTSTATANVISSTAVAQVSVSVATNCRTGPGITYDRVGFLDVGQVAEVVGRNANTNYWVIRNPNGSGGTCWLWGQFATVTGNISTLPELTPPPTPTPLPTSTQGPMPNFDVTYNSMQSCTGTGWWANIELTNTGAINFQSINIMVTDTTNNTAITVSADGFVNLTGCNGSQASLNLPTGQAQIVSLPAFQYDPTGHKLTATITLCSQPGQKGSCVLKSLDFTP